MIFTGYRRHGNVCRKNKTGNKKRKKKNEKKRQRWLPLVFHPLFDAVVVKNRGCRGYRRADRGASPLMMRNKLHRAAAAAAAAERGRGDLYISINVKISSGYYYYYSPMYIPCSAWIWHWADSGKMDMYCHCQCTYKHRRSFLCLFTFSTYIYPLLSCQPIGLWQKLHAFASPDDHPPYVAARLDLASKGA